MHRTLDTLQTDEFAIRFSFVSNPRAIHRALQRSREIEELRAALQSGEVTEESLGAFSAELLARFERCKRFEHELALAAIAVAIETRATRFAEEFVSDLAQLDCAELAIAIRVARESCRVRRNEPANRTKVFRLTSDCPPNPGWKKGPEATWVNVGHAEERFSVQAQ